MAFSYAPYAKNAASFKRTNLLRLNFDKAERQAYIKDIWDRLPVQAKKVLFDDMLDQARRIKTFQQRAYTKRDPILGGLGGLEEGDYRASHQVVALTPTKDRYVVVAIQAAGMTNIVQPAEAETRDAITPGSRKAIRDRIVTQNRGRVNIKRSYGGTNLTGRRKDRKRLGVSLRGTGTVTDPFWGFFFEFGTKYKGRPRQLGAFYAALDKSFYKNFASRKPYAIRSLGKAYQRAVDVAAKS